MLERFLGFTVISVVFVACATGQITSDRDSGPGHPDSGKGNDGSTTIKDSGPPKDSSTVIQDGSTCNFTVCGSLCVDTSQDDNNCGQCNKACLTGSSCTNSQCGCLDSAETLCTNGCYDLMTDTNNCGTCGKACTGGTTCTNGTCQAASNGAPPKGTCSHDLCTAFLGALTPGCDPSGCVSNLCAADDFCCSDDWDDLCVIEVADYCPPYSCP